MRSLARLDRTSTVVLGSAAAALLLGLGLLLSAERGAVASDALLPSVGTAQGKGTLEVDALRVGRGESRVTAQLRGVLRGVRSVELAAEVAGTVLAVPAEEHAPVAAGDLLVRLDPVLLEAAVARAEASLLRTRAVHQLARLDLDRQRDLAARQVASTAELDRAESEERSSRAAVAEARASLDDANARLDKTRIVAPFDAIVNWLDLEPGAYVKTGARLAELIDISAIEVEVGVSDRQVVTLRPGDSAMLEVDVYPGEQFAGSIARIGRAADSRTQQYPVEVQVPNPDERLLPGMLGRVHLVAGQARTVMLLPRRAMQREFDLDYVFVLELQGGSAMVTRRRVQTRPVPFRPDMLEVVSGLEEGDWVAISNLRELATGQRVQIREKSG
jgi:RND family efflux transporter MFP subunit